MWFLRGFLLGEPEARAWFDSGGRVTLGRTELTVERQGPADDEVTLELSVEDIQLGLVEISHQRSGAEVDSGCSDG